MTYLPKLESDDCVVVDNLNNGYIRVYDRVPYANSTISYIDYFLDYDYITRTGTQSFTQYNYSVNCQSHSDYTTDFYYRIDFDSVLIIFFIILCICYYMVYKPFSRFLGRWSKI